MATWLLLFLGNRFQGSRASLRCLLGQNSRMDAGERLRHGEDDPWKIVAVVQSIMGVYMQACDPSFEVLFSCYGEMLLFCVEMWSLNRSTSLINHNARTAAVNEKGAYDKLFHVWIAFLAALNRQVFDLRKNNANKTENDIKTRTHEGS